MYGWHAVLAALSNPERKAFQLFTTLATAKELPHGIAMSPRMVSGEDLDRLCGKGAVHQGIALEVAPLEVGYIEEVLESDAPLLILDQVTDPHNIGAMLRSAAAFGAAAVISPKDHSCKETAAMAKAASGALDSVRRIEVTNLATALRDLKDAGFWVMGLDGAATHTLHANRHTGKCALVMGAEGKGLRRLTAETCDMLVKLPMDSAMESLNVSNAAAVALYQLYLWRMGA